jgi:two-component system, NarL family, response regulator NreC
MAAHLHLARAPMEADALSRAAPISVVLAEDHALMRHSLRLLLESEDGVDVLSEVEDVVSAVCCVHSRKPDVLVLDLRLRGGSSIEAIGELSWRAPDTKVVVLTMNDSAAFAQHALASGALGFVLKDRADSELPRAVRAAVRGEEFVSPRVATRLESLRRSLDRES